MGLITALLGAITTIAASLPQTTTNGNSALGTLIAPILTDFLTDNPLPNGFPWGADTPFNTNPYTQSPNTGNWAIIGPIMVLIDARCRPFLQFHHLPRESGARWVSERHDLD
jgi:hypothetical protein